MNILVLNLDTTKNLKKNIETNIKSIIKKYSNKIKLENKPFKKTIEKYKMKIMYKDEIKTLNLFYEKNLLDNNIFYRIQTTDDEKLKPNKNNNVEKSYNTEEVNWPGIEIHFLLKDYHKNDAYIEFIAKNEKHKINTGTYAINLAIRLCKYLNVKNAFLQDASNLTCINKNDMSLSLYKILTTGNTWYEKYGFHLNVPNYKQINNSIRIVQNIRISDILDVLIKIRNAISKSIENGKIEKLKFWSPTHIHFVQHNIIRLSEMYAEISESISLLKKYMEKNDSIKSYSDRVGKENCEVYIKTIQNICFHMTEYNIGYHMLVAFYNNKIITLHNIKDIYIISYLIHNYLIKYKKKI